MFPRPIQLYIPFCLRVTRECNLFTSILLSILTALNLFSPYQEDPLTICRANVGQLRFKYIPLNHQGFSR